MQNNKSFKTSLLRHIVTSTDANYLHKAIVLYKSLSKVHKNFLLHMFCFDDTAYNILDKLDYKNIMIYHPTHFENKELLKVKASKVKRYEYYWACNPFLTRKVLLEQDTNFISSCDCDLMFFQSPEVIFKELGNADVLIQPNNFSFQFVNDFVRVGYYCTSFQCFRKNKNSKKILDWWHERTMEWCSSKFEGGKFGEQKYLDNWRTQFKNVREIANIGTNVAPWNIQKYDVTKHNDSIMLNDNYSLVYYHYHSLRINLKNYRCVITGDRHNYYPIPPKVVEIIYKPYIKLLKETIKELKNIKEYRDYVQINPEGVQIPFRFK